MLKVSNFSQENYNVWLIAGVKCDERRRCKFGQYRFSCNCNTQAGIVIEVHRHKNLIVLSCSALKCIFRVVLKRPRQWLFNNFLYDQYQLDHNKVLCSQKISQAFVQKYFCGELVHVLFWERPPVHWLSHASDQKRRESQSFLSRGGRCSFFSERCDVLEFLTMQFFIEFFSILNDVIFYQCFRKKSKTSCKRCILAMFLVNA